MRHYGFGLLPDFTSSDTVANKYIGLLSGQITRAIQVQKEVAPLLSRPEAAQLNGVIAGLESSILTVWNNLLGGVAAQKQFEAARTAITSTPPPSQSSFQYPGGDGYYYQAVDAYTQKVNAAGANVAKQQTDNAALKDQLAALLTQYNDKVPAAAKLVSAVANAEIKVEAAHQEVQAATSTNQATVATAQTFALQQQLDTLKAAASAATAKVAEPVTSGGPSPLMIAAIAIPVLGLGAFFLARKKSASVAGYRRRRRSRR